MNKEEAIQIIKDELPNLYHSFGEAIVTLIPELKENKEERIVNLLKMVVEKWHNVGYADYVMDIPKSDIRAWLEKQSEQVDKVKPKFKVGDWITDGNITIQIEAIKNNCYLYCGDCALYSTKTADKVYHIWTIQDAKDGDVLVDEDNNIGIHKEIEGLYWNSFIYLGCDGKLRGFSIGGSHKQANTHPATKDQHYALFTKIREAGYEFDFEKKELKKIEDEKYNGEDYGIDSLYHAQRILEKTLGNVEGYQSDDGILEHKCAISAVKKLYEQKPWNEDDDNCLSTIIAEFSKCSGKSVSKDEWMRCNDFLNSLRDRVQPQPKQEWSEEDERMYRGLHNLIYSTPYCDSRNELSDWLKSLKDRVQPKPQQKWSEEDEKLQSNLIRWQEEWLSSQKNGGYMDNENLIKSIEKSISWLHHIKDRIQPQPKQEWSQDDMGEMIYDKVLDGETLVKEVVKENGSITDDKGKSYWWNTIDRSKKYQVRKYEYERALQDYPVISYKIKEL